MDSELRHRLAHLVVEHGDLAASIDALQVQPVGDQLAIARLKKRKLRLKDEINLLQDQLVPDISA